ncbi:MAG: TRAP transporter substrate-binding protein DctP, partial [Desulfobacteraceae bacterium]|nr:TRAP transporter substrate-binding protein DctP [Desulfobacteraceae bacterium]
MKMKGFNFWLMFMGTVLSLIGTAFAETPPKILIKMATIAPKGSFMMRLIDEMDADIRRETGNEVGIKLYYGSVQGDEKEVLSKIRLGQLHGGTFTGAGLGRIVPEVRVTEVPYVFMNYDEVEYVREQLRDYMDQRFAEKGFIVLGWNEIGFVYTFSKVPITSLEVARSQKWWQWEDDPLSKAMFDAFGITPVPLAFTDVMTSLSTRLIDTASITPYGAVAFHWFDRFEYMSEYPVTNVQGATIVSKNVWDKISPESQKKILTICQPYFDRLSEKGREQDRQSVEVLKKSGIKIVSLD